MFVESFLLFFTAIIGVLMMRLLYLPLTMISQEEKAKLSATKKWKFNLLQSLSPLPFGLGC